MADVKVAGNDYVGITEVHLPLKDDPQQQQAFIIPSGSTTISQNANNIDVAQYATVNVQVAPNLQELSVTAPATGTDVREPSGSYVGFSKVTVSPTPVVNKTGANKITVNGTYDPPIDKHFGQVVVDVQGGVTPSLRDLTVTPSESIQTFNHPDYDGYDEVIVNAISSTYIGSGVTKKSAQTYTPGTQNQTISAGQYLNGAQTIAGDTDLVAGNIKSGVNIFGVIGTYTGSGSRMQSKTVTPGANQQTVTPDSGYDGLSQVTVNAIPYTETDNLAGGKTVTIGG